MKFQSTNYRRCALCPVGAISKSALHRQLHNASDVRRNVGSAAVMEMDNPTHETIVLYGLSSRDDKSFPVPLRFFELPKIYNNVSFLQENSHPFHIRFFRTYFIIYFQCGCNIVVQYLNK